MGATDAHALLYSCMHTTMHTVQVQCIQYTMHTTMHTVYNAYHNAYSVQCIQCTTWFVVFLSSGCFLSHVYILSHGYFHILPLFHMVTFFRMSFTYILYHMSSSKCSQATIMTDPGVADRTYVGPMTVDAVEEILIKVQ